MMSKNESGFPIPADWLLTTGVWTGFCIAWPESEAWALHLRSLLYHLTRGRTWDAQTGTITTAQAIAWEIYNRNAPLVLCGDCEECPPEPQNGTSGAFGACSADDSEGDSEMGQVVTDVQVVDGKIRVFYGPCCYVDLTGITADQVSPDIGDDPLVPPGGSPPAYSACGKAYAVVKAIETCLIAMFAAVVEVDWPWQILGHVEQSVGYNLDNKWMAALYVDVSSLISLGLGAADIFTPIDQQEMICKLVNLFGDNALGVPDSATYDALKAAITTSNFVYSGVLETAVACFGRGNLDTIAKLAADDTTRNCNCPDQTAELFFGVGTGFAWRYVFDFRASQHSWTLDDSNTRWSSGLGLWAENQVTLHKAKIDASRPIDQQNNGSTLKLIGVVLQMAGDETYEATMLIGTNAGNLIPQADLIAMTGNAPSAAGTYTIMKTVDDALGADETALRCLLECQHLTDVSQKIVGLYFAGTGPGPLSTPPA